MTLRKNGSAVDLRDMHSAAQYFEYNHEIKDHWVGSLKFVPDNAGRAKRSYFQEGLVVKLKRRPGTGGAFVLKSYVHSILDIYQAT